MPGPELIMRRYSKTIQLITARETRGRGACAACPPVPYRLKAADVERVGDALADRGGRLLDRLNLVERRRPGEAERLDGQPPRAELHHRLIQRREGERRQHIETDAEDGTKDREVGRVSQH